MSVEDAIGFPGSNLTLLEPTMHPSQLNNHDDEPQPAAAHVPLRPGPSANPHAGPLSPPPGPPPPGSPPTAEEAEVGAGPSSGGGKRGNRGAADREQQLNKQLKKQGGELLY